MTSFLASVIGAVVLAGVQRFFPKLSVWIHQGTATSVTLPPSPVKTVAATPPEPFQLTRRVKPVKKTKRRRVSQPAVPVTPEAK